MAAPIKLVEPSQSEQVAALESKTKKENRFARALAHRPEVMKHFLPAYGAIMGVGSVDRRLKELAYIATSYANECEYCLNSHLQTGRKAGITEDEFRAVQLEQNTGFTPQERSVLQYARELTRTATGEVGRNELPDYFTDEQIVEITMVVAMANFTNRFNNGLGLKPEE
jgi:uncharacterized peroxidase-related enzyme